MNSIFRYLGIVICMCLGFVSYSIGQPFTKKIQIYAGGGMSGQESSFAKYGSINMKTGTSALVGVSYNIGHNFIWDIRGMYLKNWIKQKGVSKDVSFDEREEALMFYALTGLGYNFNMAQKNFIITLESMVGVRFPSNHYSLIQDPITGYEDPNNLKNTESTHLEYNQTTPSMVGDFIFSMNFNVWKYKLYLGPELNVALNRSEYFKVDYALNFKLAYCFWGSLDAKRYE